MTKDELVKLVNKEDFLEYMSSLSKDEVQKLLGEKFARMVGYDQKNIHHCYDLWNHILHTVDNVDKDGLSKENITNLKIAALYHDIGKPDVAMYKPERKQQVYYGHAKKSEEIAKEELTNVGLSPEEINKICFLIEHHDDFISYHKELPEYQKGHEFLREIDEKSVAEKMIENKYDFEKMGLNKDQIRIACYYYAHGNAPTFKFPNGKDTRDLEIDVLDISQKMMSDEYLKEYIPTLEDYNNLMNICKADANAQTELYIENGKTLCSRKEKNENINSVEKVLEEAYKKLDEVKCVIDSSLFLNNVIGENQKKIEIEKDAKKIQTDYSNLEKKEIKDNGCK